MVEAVQQNANLQFLHRHCLLSPTFSRNSISQLSTNPGSTNQEISCYATSFRYLYQLSNHPCIQLCIFQKGNIKYQLQKIMQLGIF